MSFLPNPTYHDFAWALAQGQCDSWENWHKEDNGYYKPDLIRYQHVIGDQLDLIKGKRILDIGCNAGILSMFCLHNGAEHVTGIDVRDKELSVAQKVCETIGYKNCDFKNLNIHDYDKLTEACNQVDTVLMSGVFYHLNDHVQVLEAIAKSTATSLILESQIWLSCPDIPSLFWRMEHTSDPHHALELDGEYKTVVVGVPNRNFVEKLMMYVGYKIIYNEQFEHLKREDSLLRHSCVISGTKDSTHKNAVQRHM